MVGTKRKRSSMSGPFARIQSAKRARRSPVRRSRTRGGLARTGGFTGIELKFLDSSLVGSAITAPTDATGGEHDPATLLALNSIAQGDGEENRDGRRATMKSIYVTGQVRLNQQGTQTSLPGSGHYFIALVADTQTNGAQLNSEDVFKNEAANAVLAANPYRNLQNSTRFKVLDSVMIHRPMPSTGQDAAGTYDIAGDKLPWKLSKKFADQRILFSGTTGVVANITDYSLHIIAFASDVDGVPTLDYNSRLRFVG